MPRKFDSETFLNAVENNNLVELGKMLGSMNKTDPQEQLYSCNSGDETAPILAAKNGKLASLRMLIKYLITLNSSSTQIFGTCLFNDPLITAAQYGHPACLRKLLENAGQLFITNESVNKAFIAAAEHGQTACLRLLLEYHEREKAQTSHTGREESTEQFNIFEISFDTFNEALIVTTQHGHTECFRLLIECADIFDVSPEACSTSTHSDREKKPVAELTPIADSANRAQRTPEDMAMDTQRLPADTYSELLIATVQNGHIETLRLLIENAEKFGIASGTRSSSTHSDREKKPVAGLRLIGDSANRVQKTPADMAMDTWRQAAIYAADKPNAEYLRLLVNTTTNPVVSQAAAFSAAINGRIECLRYLIVECGVDVNSRYHDGCTLVMLAAENGHPECLEWLMDTQYQYHTSANISSDVGYTATQTTSPKQTFIDLNVQHNTTRDTAISLVAKVTKALKAENKPIDDHIRCMALLLNKDVGLTDQDIELFKSKTIKEKLFDCIRYTFPKDKVIPVWHNATAKNEDNAFKKVFWAPRNKPLLPFFSFFKEMAECSEKKGTLSKIKQELDEHAWHANDPQNAQPALRS